MPIEKRPAHLVPKGPPRDSRPAGHKVSDNETFESIAHRYKIPVKQLIFFNFGTLNPAELNWYLREYVGCNLATHDKKNWRFSASAKPGLIYLPDNVMRMDPVIIIGQVSAPAVTQPTIDLAKPGVPEFLASEKFSHEWKWPPEAKDFGNILAQAKIYIEGEIKQQKGVLKTAIKKNQIKLAIEKKLTDELKLAFGAKFEEKVLSNVVTAIQKGGKGDIAQAIGGAFEASLKSSYHWGNVAVTPEIGAEISKTPIILRVSGDYEDAMFMEGVPFRGKFSVKIGINVGLSVKGWTWVASKVGPQALKRYLMQGGRVLASIAEWLVSEAVLTAGAIIVGALAGTFGLVCLTGWITTDARHKGALLGLATWYGAAYAAKVFGDPRPSGSVYASTPEENKRRSELMDQGEKDAVADARAAAGSVPDADALAALRDAWTQEARGNPMNGKIMLREALLKRAKALVGL